MKSNIKDPKGGEMLRAVPKLEFCQTFKLGKATTLYSDHGDIILPFLGRSIRGRTI